MEQIRLETPRLLLSSIDPAFTHHLFNTKSREEIIAFFQTDEEGYEGLKRRHEKGMETVSISMIYFLILDKQTKKVIGECGFHTWNAKHRRAEIFYSLKNDIDKQKGIMTEALGAVLEFGFRELGLHRVEGMTSSDNHASLQLMKKYGFKREGTLREHYNVNGTNEDSECFSLLKWEWEALRSG